MKRLLILICCVFIFSNVGVANAELFTMVYDKYNDIFWTQARDSEGDATNQNVIDAVDWAQGLEVGAMQDWMLPSTQQLSSLYEDNGLKYTYYPFTLNNSMSQKSIVWAYDDHAVQYNYHDKKEPYGEIDNSGYSSDISDPYS